MLHVRMSHISPHNFSHLRTKGKAQRICEGLVKFLWCKC